MPNLERTKQTNEADRYTTMLEQKVGKLEEVVYGITWDDLKAPATAINPAGSPSPASVNTDDGSLEFAKNPATNVVVVWFQLPHDYVEGSNIKVHIHWAKKTSATGTVNWQMKYKWANIGDIMPSFPGTLITAEEKVANRDTAELHALASFGEIDGTGKKIGSMICIYLQRTSGDSFAGDARLFEIDIHYQRNIYSSKEEYRKVKYG